MSTTTAHDAIVLTDSKGNVLEVNFIVKVADLGDVQVTRLERKSKRVVLKTEDGKLHARAAHRVTAIKSHGRFKKAKVAAKAKAAKTSK